MKTVLRLSLIILIVFILPLLAFNCSGPSRKLIGTWKAQTGCGSISMTFYKDGTGSYIDPINGGKEFKWKIEDDELVMSDDSGKIERARFELKENDLILNYQNYSYTFHRLR